jgi:hypothetical protein
MSRYPATSWGQSAAGQRRWLRRSTCQIASTQPTTPFERYRPSRFVTHASTCSISPYSALVAGVGQAKVLSKHQVVKRLSDRPRRKPTGAAERRAAFFCFSQPGAPHFPLPCVILFATAMHNHHRPPSPAMRVASEMPPLTHWLGHDQTFSITQSEVCRWLVKQPECLQFLFNAVKNAGVITFDLESRTWRGIAWKAPR